MSDGPLSVEPGERDVCCYRILLSSYPAALSAYPAYPFPYLATLSARNKMLRPFDLHRFMDLALRLGTELLKLSARI